MKLTILFDDGCVVFESSAAPGFRFCPTDQELVNYFLRSKITGVNHQALHFIPQLDPDFFKWEPWDLPGYDHFITP
jgi:hypothetical protein